VAAEWQLARSRAIVTLPGQWPRLALVALLACWIVPEALAAPYAAATGAGDRGVGVLLAAMPAGFAGAAVGGVIAQVWSVGPAIGIAGATGPLGAVVAGLAMLRSQRVSRSDAQS
jgi:hypothetical protein